MKGEAWDQRREEAEVLLLSRISDYRSVLAVDFTSFSSHRQARGQSIWERLITAR